MTTNELTASLNVIKKELEKIGAISLDIQPYTNKISIHLYERDLPQGERNYSDNDEFIRESVNVDGVEFFRLLDKVEE